MVRVGMSVTEGLEVVLADTGPLLEFCIFCFQEAFFGLPFILPFFGFGELALEVLDSREIL